MAGRWPDQGPDCMVEPVGSDAKIVGCDALVDLQSERIKDALVAKHLRTEP
jgi:hypothetical protein